MKFKKPYDVRVGEVPYKDLKSDKLNINCSFLLLFFDFLALILLQLLSLSSAFATFGEGLKEELQFFVLDVHFSLHSSSIQLDLIRKCKQPIKRKAVPNLASD